MNPISSQTTSGEYSCPITIDLNGEEVAITVEVRRLLSDVLREDLGLTGTHVGCEHGVCGSCTVLLDGVPIRSCLMLGVQADGRRLTTIEGIDDGEGGLHPVQQAFCDRHGLQCGYCTPGLVMTVVALEQSGTPGSETLADHISGHLCRCTGYRNIVEAAQQALGKPWESR